jgi:hypothetical protein
MPERFIVLKRFATGLFVLACLGSALAGIITGFILFPLQALVIFLTVLVVRWAYLIGESMYD